MGKIQDINIGQIADLEHIVTGDDLKRFVELTGDDNRLHTDPEYASHTSLKKPVVHGMLGASFISTIIGTKLPGDGALWFSQKLDFLLPVRIGDRLTVRAEVISKDERAGIIELKTDILNQYRQKVTTGTAKVKMIENELDRPSDAPSGPKAALVIGGTGSIGAAICTKLADEGFDLAIHYHNNGELARKLAEEFQKKNKSKVIVCQADIINEFSVNEMMQYVARNLGPITVLVNCATARIAAIRLGDLKWSDFEDHLSVAIRGTFNVVRGVLPWMEKGHYGKLINVNSQFLDAPATNLIPYITAKGALMGFTRALAFDLAPKGIRVNSVSPGMTESVQIADIPERVRLATAAKTPLRRLAKPEDIAKVVAFLASDSSDFLAGETIRVNGGQLML